MDKKYNVKAKLGDGRYWSFGNVTPGEKGPRMGLKVTPELRQVVANAQDGGWINFLLFEDDGQRQPDRRGGPTQRRHPMDDDSIPF